MPKFIALKKGFDGEKIVEEGEEFEADKSYGAWMQPVDEEPEVEPVQEQKVKKPRKPLAV